MKHHHRASSWVLAGAILTTPVGLVHAQGSVKALSPATGNTSAIQGNQALAAALAQPGNQTLNQTVNQPLNQTGPSSVTSPLNENYAYPASTVFGANLFQGNFAAESVSVFNPDHVISIGNLISVRIWGLFDFQADLTVDEQGNIFVPRIGPVKIQGVLNKELTKVVDSKIKSVYSGNVGVYCNLAVAQPVKVYVTGGVRAPGVYSGTTSDSILRFLDRARGIDPDRGSFIAVDVMRRGTLLQRFDLYEFIHSGSMPGIQLLDGDTILVRPRQNLVTVTGTVQNANVFEFATKTVPAKKILDLAVPLSGASNVRIVHRTEGVEHVEYLTIADAEKTELQPGDQVDVIADRKTKSIAIRVEGEHLGEQVVVVPYGSKLKDVVKEVQWAPTSDKNGLQLFRQSVKESQREMLLNALDRLQKTILTSQSTTTEEARIRASEAESFLQWIDKARKIEPKGQVVIEDGSFDILLEPGDVLRVARKSDVVTVLGEVNFPSSFAYGRWRSIEDYIEMAGNYNEFGDSDQVLLLRPNGAYVEAMVSWFWSTGVHPGDQIVVLPEVKTRYLQIAKDVTQIMYQIAISAGVALKVF